MKIFVSIASYCDELLFFTIEDCMAKASKPENIFFGIVDQNIATQRAEIEKLDFKNQIKYVYINNIDTLGVSWARNIAFSLWDGEDFLLQIDSHMLFEKEWDTTLLSQYSDLKKISQKPIITTYPYNFSFDENNTPTFVKPSGKTVLVLRPHPDTPLEENNAIIRFRAEHKYTDSPVLGCHIAAGFIFTCSDFIEEIPYDPFLYFHGEEQSLALRAYTRGWDIYHPNVIPLYHHYKKIGDDYLTHHWHKSVEAKRSLSSSHLKSRAIKKINRLLYGDGMKNSVYGLGNTRTLEEYIAFSGIDYKNKKINKIEF
jgi:glycosyltransferase involved in cell wall biosynthesis